MRHRAVADKSEVDKQIDDAMAALKRRTGKSKVNVVAHSLGTSVMYDYLTNGSTAAQRRANVARYINVDGQDQNPGLPTLAVWAGRGTPGRHMDGAQNVTIPNQTHVQTCTSSQSFIAYYRFLTGHRPAEDIVRQRGTIQVAGKALNFPQNTGLSGAAVQVWPLRANGTRSTAAPLRSVALDRRRRVGTGQRLLRLRPRWEDRPELPRSGAGEPSLHPGRGRLRAVPLAAQRHGHLAARLARRWACADAEGA